MGNISSPVITRLGINQFWYRHWYSDTLNNFSKSLHSDLVIENLLHVYLNYGLNYKTNPLVHEFFFSRRLRSSRLRLSTTNLKFFRRFFFNNPAFGVENSYVTRIQSGEYFPMRLVVMRYENWVIVIINWFKPVKKRVNKFNTFDRYVRKQSATALYGFDKLRNFNRLKVLIFYFLKNTGKITNEYKF